jgi:hypothetical protein
MFRRGAGFLVPQGSLFLCNLRALLLEVCVLYRLLGIRFVVSICCLVLEKWEWASRLVIAKECASGILCVVSGDSRMFVVMLFLD